jgi:hypothetical protein
MNARLPVLVSLTLLVLAVSGGTIPGTDIVIPWISGGSTIDYTNDIIIIKSLQAVPGTTVKAGQTLTLYADIQNVQDPEKAADEIVKDVKAELYDHCTNLFDRVEPNEECRDLFVMSPQEIKQCYWTLTPREDVNLITPCELKVKVSYPHETRTVTSITFIDATELENRIRRGEPWQTGGSTTRGYGPVKVFLDVETQQPVPDSDSGEGATASVSMKIRNVGQGYVKDSAIEQGEFIPPYFTGGLWWKDGCDFNYQQINDITGIKMVRKESTPKFCNVIAPDVDIEQTYDMNTAVKYSYEFRKSVHVQIEPR